MNQIFLLIDNHEAALTGVCNTLESYYPEANIETASSIRQAEILIKSINPTLIITDLSLREKVGQASRIGNGIQLISHLLGNRLGISFVVYSENSFPLVRIKSLIDEYPLGFTVANKNSSLREMIAKVDWALKGLIYMPPELRLNLDIKEEWMVLIDLGFNKSMQDKEIAQQMNVSERTIRHYWSKLQIALSVYPSDNINIRIQTYKRAREMGLLD